MSSKKKTSSEEKPSTRIPRKYVIALGVIIVICIAIVAGLVLTKQGPWADATANIPVTDEASFMSAGALYCQSVDLANEGNYTGALADANAALAYNVPSLIPLIQSNRAGILVETGNYSEAIDAADVAISAPGNLTTLRAIAYYNKANALEALGRTSEADANYANASALDPTLKHP
ncbi:Tetratricopeptide TPR_2 repeat protein [Methanoregula boonei 6A8]|jgi:tetratricopeptide (TPR) repeat protein|uniref:Tetratricopeptide TPR_2 repeat protein n=1 Tax=Methanoregula boonei (strain DSM 21154 / JCM 14090 / 6A8) TaxID=456442 RepID=A7I8Y2_METB6|nr:tetratricopeptide repeat protein [Methanoregula boonei]ABS56193.1 Tetratricopeptide TPR_2 repeat protein [Methanoregula boonei 6A8]